ncbi:hypothetical protein PBY51_016685 [Eleginops maclovinus]|uniref:Uncharacterized protein n=1 Tax=Eleginops maclovinus TaxID=56733 RepID=A0AAN7WQB6_ELEMC|nr:hypothetical protein PBY51_016685 [Eleginops maclovinus]
MRLINMALKITSQPNPRPNMSAMSYGVRPLYPSAAQQDDDVDEEQADEDEGEVDEELLQVPLGLGSHLDHGCSTYGRLGHVLDTLHGDRLDFD